MLAEFVQIPDGSGEILSTNGVNLSLVLIGRRCPNTPDTVMEQFWLIAAKHISSMYRWKMRQGIS